MKILKILLKIIAVILLLAILLVAAAFAYVKLGPDHDISPGAFHWPKNVDREQVASMAEDLLGLMTLEEKVAQMSGQGSLLRIGLTGMIERHGDVVYSGRNERLDVPPLAFTDGPRGVTVANATCFPVAMARGASWDRELESRVGDVIGKEARAAGANYFAGLCINLLRHPGWGRAQETYGEDPYLLGEMGVALMRAVQHHNVMACAKHFALNSIEDSRYYVSVEVDERTLREVYLPHFKKCVDNGVASLMSAYNKVRGEYCGQNRYLLTKILREDWGFDGFVTSDWIAGLYDGEKGVKAGLDVEMPSPVYYGENLLELVQDGSVTETEIDAIVSRILTTKLWYATREDPMTYDKGLIAAKPHRELAREVAEKSMVLLKNEQVLPLDATQIRTVAVIGRLAEVANTGDRGSSHVNPPYVVTPLQGLRNYLGDRVDIHYANGSDLATAQTIADAADAVVVVVGLDFRDEGEYIVFDPKDGQPRTREEHLARKKDRQWLELLAGEDRLSLALSEADRQLIGAVAGRSAKTVVVLQGGSAITMNEWQDKVPAILMMWYAGMEGGNALARILFGEVNPSGKLPFTIPKDESQLPPFDPFAETVEYGYYHGYTLMDKQKLEPAFPFGFGLSYTTFSHEDLKVLTPEMAKTDTVKVSVTVRNTGKYYGEEVTQLYVGFSNSAVERPVKLLRGFQKTGLQPGGAKTLMFSVPAAELAWYNLENSKWEIEGMQYGLYIGGSSAGKDLLPDGFVISN